MLTLPRAVGALVLVKAVDVAVRGAGRLPGPLWALALAGLVAGGLALLAGRDRTGWALVLASGLAVAVDAPLELRRQHLVLLLGVALVGVVARDDGERLLLLRAQLSALYGVAALAKLNESFLGGDVLAAAVVRVPTPPLPLLLAAGAGLVALEVALAVAPWRPRRRRPGLALAVAFHTATLVLVSDAPLVALRLLVFGGLAVAVHATSAGALRPASAPRARVVTG